MFEEKEKPPAHVVLPQVVPQGSYDLAAALENLQGTPGARFAIALAVVDPAFGEKPVRMNGRGVFNCEGDTALTLNYLPAAKRANLDERFDELGLGAKDFVGEVVGIGDDLYTRLPALTAFYPGAKPWIHARFSTDDASAFELLTRGDPDCADFLPYPEYGLPEPGSNETLITDLGADTVRDRDTTHYVLSVAPAELAAAFDVTADDLDRAVRLLGGDAFDVDFWIDGDGMIRRVSYQDV